MVLKKLSERIFLDNSSNQSFMHQFHSHVLSQSLNNNVHQPTIRSVESPIVIELDANNAQENAYMGDFSFDDNLYINDITTNSSVNNNNNNNNSNNTFSSSISYQPHSPEITIVETLSDNHSNTSSHPTTAGE